MDRPEVLFVDRGRGFYTTATAVATRPFADAMAEHDLRAFMGNDASQQPGNLSEVLLHETAVAWTRALLTKTMPAAPWRETREEYAARLRSVCTTINAQHDVEGLCRAFPQRIADLVAQKGDKLRS